MTENMKAFLARVSGNRELETKLRTMDKDALIKEAAGMGITLTKEDFELEQAEMSEDELGAVAGGKQCNCVIGGGGTKPEKDNSGCICAVLGTGYDYDDRKDEYSTRCGCFVGGTGGDDPIRP